MKLCFCVVTVWHHWLASPDGMISCLVVVVFTSCYYCDLIQILYD